MEKSYVSFVGGCTPLTFANLWGPEFYFEACYKSNVITGYRKESLHIFFYICDTYGCKDPKFSEDWSAFESPPSPLGPKPQQDPLSLPFIPTKARRVRSNGGTLKILRTQEKKSFTSKNMISLDNVLWNRHYAPEFEIPTLDRLSIHVGGKGKY